MNIRNLLLFILILLVSNVPAYAENTIAAGNEDASHQYPDCGQDSIPYIMEHVRNKERWAYEALAECYRYGRGVEKSMTNALIYYDEGSIGATDIAQKAYESNPADELGFMNYLMEELDKNRMTLDEAVSLIDKYPAPLPKWAIRLKTIFGNKDIDDIKGYIESLVDLENDSADELIASMACLKILRPDTPSILTLPTTPEVMRKISLAGKKIPMMYKLAGDKYWSLYRDCPDDEQALKQAFELYHNAYIHGLLSTRDAIEILNYHDNNRLYEGFPFSNEEMDNLEQHYLPELREQFQSPCVVEEVVVLEEESEAIE